MASMIAAARAKRRRSELGLQEPSDQDGAGQSAQQRDGAMGTAGARPGQRHGASYEAVHRAEMAESLGDDHRALPGLRAKRASYAAYVAADAAAPRAAVQSHAIEMTARRDSEASGGGRGQDVSLNLRRARSPLSRSMSKAALDSIEGAQRENVAEQQQQQPTSSEDERPVTLGMRVWDWGVILSATITCIVTPYMVGFLDTGAGSVAVTYLCDAVMVADLAYRVWLHLARVRAARLAHERYRRSNGLHSGEGAGAGEGAEQAPPGAADGREVVPRDPWLVYDAVSILPLELLSWPVAAAMDWPESGSTAQTRYSRQLAFLLFSCNRLLRVRYLVTGPRLPAAWMHHPAVQILALLTSFTMVAHWFGCGAFLMGRLQRLPNRWTGNIWTDEHNIADADSFTQYVASFYWAVVTMSTTGYGDIVPHTASERALTVIILLLGAVAYGSIIGGVTVLIDGLGSVKGRLTERLKLVSRMAALHGIPAPMQNRIETYMRAQWQLDKGFNMGPVLSTMPHGVRTSVHMFLYQRLVMQVPWFQDASEHMIRAIVRRLRPMLLLRGDFLFQVRDLDADMYFVRDGVLQVLVPDLEGEEDEQEGVYVPGVDDTQDEAAAAAAGLGTGSKTAESSLAFRARMKQEVGKTVTVGGGRLRVVSFLEEGAFFGEISLLLGEARTASVRGYTETTELSVLSQEDFCEILSAFPEYAKRVRSVAASRLKRDVADLDTTALQRGMERRQSFVRMPSTAEEEEDTIAPARGGADSRAAMEDLLHEARVMLRHATRLDSRVETLGT